jgi:hypothetical protein
VIARVAGFLTYNGSPLCRPCAKARKAADLHAIVPSAGAEGIRCQSCGLPLAIATPPVDAASLR